MPRRGASRKGESASRGPRLRRRRLLGARLSRRLQSPSDPSATAELVRPQGDRERSLRSRLEGGRQSGSAVLFYADLDVVDREARAVDDGALEDVAPFLIVS